MCDRILCFFLFRFYFSILFSVFISVFFFSCLFLFSRRLLLSFLCHVFPFPLLLLLFLFCQFSRSVIHKSRNEPVFISRCNTLNVCVCVCFVVCSHPADLTNKGPLREPSADVGVTENHSTVNLFVCSKFHSFI